MWLSGKRYIKKQSKVHFFLRKILKRREITLFVNKSWGGTRTETVPLTLEGLLQSEQPSSIQNQHGLIVPKLFMKSFSGGL